MNPQPAKFLFGTEFSSGQTRRPSQTQAREAAEKAAELTAAEQRGFAAGMIAGENSASAREMARLASAVEQCVAAALHIIGALEAMHRSIEAEAVDLAVAVASSLARRLIEAEPTAEIEQVAREALTHVRRAPHLVLRVAPDLVEKVEERLKAVTWERGYEGRVIVLGEPDILNGDCRVEWADGGMVRDSAAISQAVHVAVDGYLAARSGAKEE